MSAMYDPALDPHPDAPPPIATLGPLPRRRADGWSLVLASEGIPHQIVPGADGVYLTVAAADAERASASLAAYLDENEHERAAAEFATARPPRTGPAPAVAGRADVAAGAVVGVLLLIGYAITGDAPHGGPAAAGAADSGRILGGEIWRVVTALTLHAGLDHVLANVFASAVFLPFAARRFGIGLALFGTLAAGAIGNGLTALLRGPGSVGVGFSTAVFGAVGLLAGARLVGGPTTDGRGRLLALGAAIALLAMLGAGEQTDVLAHAGGLVAGIPLGAALGLAAGGDGAAAAARRRPGGPWQIAAAAATALVVGGAWWIALG